MSGDPSQICNCIASQDCSNDCDDNDCNCGGEKCNCTSSGICEQPCDNNQDPPWEYEELSRGVEIDDTGGVPQADLEHSSGKLKEFLEAYNRASTGAVGAWHIFASCMTSTGSIFEFSVRIDYRGKRTVNGEVEHTQSFQEYEQVLNNSATSAWSVNLASGDGSNLAVQSNIAFEKAEKRAREVIEAMNN
jgi:hypothetical protein